MRINKSERPEKHPAGISECPESRAIMMKGDSAPMTGAPEGDVVAVCKDLGKTLVCIKNIFPS